MQIDTPSAFRFAATVLSHGWCQLPPFSYDVASGVLERVERLAGGKTVRLRMREGGDLRSLEVAIDGVASLSAADRRRIRALVSNCLCFDWDLKPFYRLLRARAPYAWVERRKAGRLLVTPTVWEDLAKMLLTTNTTWGGTIGMCRRLVTLGALHGDGAHSFPTPAEVASMSLRRLSERVRAGYRAPYLHELAKAIAEERIDVESWRHDRAVTTEELYDSIRSLKGFGQYAAGNMLMMLGRFDRVGIDTACRAAFRRHLKPGQTASDQAIRAYYQPFGEWRALVMWMDLKAANES